MAGVQERWVRVNSFKNRVEAETAHSALVSRGIEARLIGDDGGGVGIPMSLEDQGMEVHVAPSDQRAARQLLDLDEETPDAKPVSRPVIVLTRFHRAGSTQSQHPRTTGMPARATARKHP